MTVTTFIEAASNNSSVIWPVGMSEGGTADKTDLPFRTPLAQASSGGSVQAVRQKKKGTISDNHHVRWGGSS